MSQPLVSIIIPFYNEESCLSRAIQSALNQSYPYTEIILVNDGSTDGSKDIAIKFCEQYSNIQLINSANESLGAARNKGVQRSKGRYITFLDADDELLEEMVNQCVQRMVRDQCDVVIGRFNLLDEHQNLLKISGWRDIPLNETALKGIEAIYENKIVPTAWGKLYKKESVKTIPFPEKIWFEDNPFLLEFLFKSTSVGFIEQPLLNIHSRSNSITRRTISERRIIDLNKAFVLQLELALKYATTIQQKQNISKLIIQSQLRALFDTFMVYVIDKKKLDQLEQAHIRKTFEVAMEEVNSRIMYIKPKFSTKSRLLLIFMNLPKLVGWRIPKLVVNIFKFKKLKYLKRLKG